MVLKMDQGGLLQHQMPLHTDYGLPLDADCSDHCGTATHHDAYNHGTGIEVMRRDSAINQHMPGPFSYAPAHATVGARFVTDRGAGEAAHSGSISTSPSSAASSLAYTNYAGTHYTNIQHLPGSVPLPQAFVPSTFAEARPSALLDATSHMLPPPQRTYSNLSDRDSFSANSTPYLNRTQLSTPSFQTYTSQTYAETPRSVITGTAGLSLSPGTSPYSNVHMATAAAPNYGSSTTECTNFPWSDLEATAEMMCEGQLLVPKINAIVKGFFPDAEKRWTCYRRNYFSVTCSFELRPNIPNGRIEIRRGNSIEQVQAMGMRLSAAVDGPEGKAIELIQHTPKRDNGPKNKIEVTKVAPSPASSRVESTMSPSGVYQLSMGSFHHPSGQLPGPYLPLQGAPEADTQAGASQSSQSSNQYPYTAPGQPGLVSGQATTHSFERVQFKQATANNGKRRATQQFFHLIVELFADVRKDGNDKPVWVKAAQRVSTKIVVRGRSPSHYQGDKTDGSNLTGRNMQAANASGYTAAGSTSYASLNAGGFRSLPSVYNTGNGVSGMRNKGEFYSDHGSQSDSSSSSMDENNNIDTSYANDTIMSDAERIALHEHDGYQYYPSAIYEHVQGATSLPPLAKLNGEGGFTGDAKMYAVKSDYGDAFPGAQYQTAACNRFQGVDTSRGYFPDLQRF